MATYVEFVGSGAFTGTNAGMIRDWANRDVSVLSNSVVTKCFDYAADKAYRTLRVPPLEVTRTYVVEGTQDELDAAGAVGSPDVSPSAFLGGGAVLSITVPLDMIEVIFVRNANVLNKNPGIVYNEKVDNRTFNDGFGQTKDFFFYTRIGNQLKLHGNFKRLDEIELHYYRRLPALDATYSGTFNNWKSGLGTLNMIEASTTTYAVTVSGGKYFINGSQNPTLSFVRGNTYIFDLSDSSLGSHPLRFATAADASGGSEYTTGVTVTGTQGTSGAKVTIIVAESAPSALYYYCTNHAGMGNSISVSAAVGVATTYSAAVDKTESSFDSRLAENASYWVGEEASHWLRDENERIVLFGALLEVFIYLNDNEEILKYQQLFDKELEELNKEETNRKSRGGNSTISFTGNNLI